MCIPQLKRTLGHANRRGANNIDIDIEYDFKKTNYTPVENIILFS